MPKKIASFLFLFVWVLAACSPAGSANDAITEAPAAEQPTTVVEEAPAQPDLPTTPPLGALGEPMGGCTLSTLIRPADPEDVSLFKPISESDWSYGPADAAVTIIEYGDFQCPFCGQLAPILAQIKADYPDDVRLIFRHYPLINIHDKAATAAVAADAAGQQGKFWEMHDLLFQSQAEWGTLTNDQFGEWLLDKVETLELDTEQFLADINSSEITDKIQAEFEEGAEIPIPGTPFLIINDRIYDGPTDYNNMSLIVRMFSLEKLQYETCPAVVIDPEREYTATILTENGEIVIELLTEYAPLTVNNFVFLAREGWYDGVTFHRVLQDFMAQTGDPSGTGFGGPGYAFVNEVSRDLVFDQPGLLAMANSGPDTNGSQFFITVAPYPSLNGGYSIFGRVIAGLDVVEAISLRDPSQSLNLPPGDIIISITIDEK